MTLRTRQTLGYIGVGMAAALLAGAAVWAIMDSRLDEQATRTEHALERVDALETDIESLEARLVASGASPAIESPTGADVGTPADEQADAAASEDEGRQFCFMRGGVWEGAAPVLTVDYAQMLGGADAAAAATAHGDESPPPNDYYIVNDNPRLREFPADPSITVMIASMDEGVRPEGYAMAFGEWFDVLVGMSGGDFVRNMPYWITIEDGTIVAIEEQYLP